MEKKVRTRRVGSLTAGLSMVVFGVLFILQGFVSTITYVTILQIWPVILIGMGIELLLSNFSEKYVYDKGAIVLLLVLAVFAMGMASVNACFQMVATHMDLIEQIW